MNKELCDFIYSLAVAVPVALATGFAFGAITDAADAKARYNTYSDYPVCSPVANVVQEHWHEGWITRSEAEEIIESCLEWEDKQ